MDDTQNEGAPAYLHGKKLSHGSCFMLARELLVQLGVYKPYVEDTDTDAMRQYSIEWLNRVKKRNTEGKE